MPDRDTGYMARDPDRRPPDRPRTVRVSKNVEETDIVRTIVLEDVLNAPDGRAGQFIMVWIPDMDEIPMSLTHLGREKAMAVHEKGEATAALSRIKAGERIGIRGPYGNGFEIGDAWRVLAVTGGTGVAPLAPLMESDMAEFTVVMGAQTAGELLYMERLKSTYADLHITTDDGSAGTQGLASDLAEELISGDDFDAVLTCGPEKMMEKVARACVENSIPCQCSTERFMKCGIGICDSCSLGGYQVCRDGPVFEASMLLEIPEFGEWRRGPSGKREPLE